MISGLFVASILTYKVWTLYWRFVVAKQLVDHVTSSLTNRNSRSTPAETQDRKCFSMQLILVIGKMETINHICQMLSFCWKLLSAYFAKKWLLSTLLSTLVTAMCACIRNTNVCFFPMYACNLQVASQVGQVGSHTSYTSRLSIDTAYHNNNTDSVSNIIQKSWSN